MSRHTRLTLVAQRGRNELVVMLRRRGQQQTVLYDGQLVCSRKSPSEELVLGPAATLVDPSWIRDAIGELVAITGHTTVKADNSEPIRARRAGDQLELPVSLATGPVAHRCERCSSSMIYEGPDLPVIRLCPPCQKHQSTHRIRTAALQVEVISGELTEYLRASQRQLTGSRRNDVQRQLRRLQRLGETLRREDDPQAGEANPG
jgi:hypothetical protein